MQSLMKSAACIAAIWGGLLALAAPAQEAMRNLELISDADFRCGFQALGVHPLRQERGQVLQPPEAPCAPVWQLCEWWCAQSLVAGTTEHPREGVVRFALPNQFVEVDHAQGMLTLGLNSTAERDGKPRTADEDWPHLLIQQQLAPGGERCPTLDKLTALPFTVEARVVRDDRSTPPGYSTSRHAAQFLIYFTVTNRHTGDFLWFGVTLYDDRQPYPPLSTFPGDAGSAGLGKFIYSPAASEFTPKSLHDGGWVRYEADLLPLMLAGLARAREEDFLTASENPADYYVSYMNLGLELPGLHDFVGQIRGLSLKARFPE